MFKKKTAAGLLVIIMLLTLFGCSNTPQNLEYKAGAPYRFLSSMTVATNSDYELLWNKDECIISLKNLKTGTTWSTIPQDYLMSGGTNAGMLSPLNLTVVNTSTLTWDTINGYKESIVPQTVRSERVEGGLKVTYYLENFEISVPIIYTLYKDSLKITIDPKEIREGEKYLLAAVSVAPMLCSAMNSGLDSYVFIPSGTGAIMNTSEDARGTRKYSGDVYGEDLSRIITTDFTDETPIRIPVFGVKSLENALFGIIEKGAESVVIEAETGNKRTGRSAVWATLNIRGYDIYPTTSSTTGFADMKRMSAQHSETPVSIGYYPLEGSVADYNGMAKRYRQYLIENKEMVETTENEGYYGLTIYGGISVPSTILGIPIKTTEAMTTFAQAKEMVKSLHETTKLSSQIKLVGFGETGINIGKIAGGYAFSNVLGNDSQRKSLSTYCNDESIPLYTDFDLIRYSNSGDGFSYTFGAAKSATLHTAERKMLDTPLRNKISDSKYRLLGREDITTAVKKLSNFAADNNLSGISLSSLGEYAYSDFGNRKYIVKNNMATDVTEYIKLLREKKYPVASGSNSYAAAAADAIFDVPLNSGCYDVFDADIPFYQLVFCGSKPMFSSGINLEGDFDRQVMQAISGGTGLGFSLIYDFIYEHMQNQSGNYYAAVFRDNITLIEQTINKYADFYKAIAGKKIESYELLSNGISKTLFENGVTVYSNLTSSAKDSPAGTLERYGVSVMKSN
ncbi:MAG: DUF5696 domain-containing protein [Eubacteriales bacterium]|nr:DUF5696 domain-containing protein [Eubacteriales bacterium]